MTDDMNFDDNDAPASNDFWGSTPDWSTSTGQTKRSDKRTTKRTGNQRRSNLSGTIRGIWGAAMTAGADATREHKVFDATARPEHDGADTSPGIDPTMFDDLDADFDAGVPSVDFTGDFNIDLTGDLIVDRTGDVDHVAETMSDNDPAVTAAWSGHDDSASSEIDDPMTAFAPIGMSEHSEAKRIDPLIARVGAVAVVATLLVPLAIGFTTGDDADDTIASNGSTASSIELVLSEPAVETAVAGTTGSDSAPLDPATLPPAVPVSTDAATTTEAPATELVAASDTNTESAADTGAATDTAVTTDSSSEPTSSNSSSETATTADNAVNGSASADDDADRVTNCAIDYEVQAGDFWIRLADGAGVALAELLEANGATVNTPLFPGTKICLPAGSTTPPPPPATTTPDTTPATTTAPTTTTTTTTTTTAPPTTTPPSEGSVQQIIRDVWPDELEDRALEIAFRESRYVPTAQNYCCYGLFQIYFEVHRSWLADIGITSAEQLFDPTTNATAAYTLYQRAGGWGPWAL